MFEIYPIPSWDKIHPLIVHFPIALLSVAPVFILMSFFAGRLKMAFKVAALTLMVLGTLGVFLAMSSGSAAEHEIEAGLAHEAHEVLEEHEDLAKNTRNFFVTLTLLYAVILIGQSASKKEMRLAAAVPVYILFLAAYGAGILVLQNTGHHGAMLVHDHGAHNPITPGIVVTPHEHGPEDAHGGGMAEGDGHGGGHSEHNGGVEGHGHEDEPIEEDDGHHDHSGHNH